MAYMSRKTQSKVQQYAYWPGWRKDTELYVKICDTCNRARKGPRRKQGEMSANYSDGPFNRVHIDLTGPHPTSSGGRQYLLTMIDSFTKYLICCPLRNKTAKEVTSAIVKNLILVHEACDLLVSDNGTEFVNEISTGVYEATGIQHLRVTSYRPQGNGQIEVTHRLINQVLTKTVKQNLRNWDLLIPSVTFAYNTSRHSSTTFTPYYLIYLR